MVHLGTLEEALGEEKGELVEVVHLRLEALNAVLEGVRSFDRNNLVRRVIGGIQGESYVLEELSPHFPLFESGARTLYEAAEKLFF